MEMETLSCRMRLCLVFISFVAVLSGCSKEPPPRTVQEFMDDQILLEAALVRCRQDRATSRYEPECVNAREAVKIIEAREEAERRELLEAQSKRKREALRRTQEAAAEARRQVAEAERRRREAEYLAQFGHPPPPESDAAGDAAEGNAPMAVLPEPGEQAEEDTGYRDPLSPAGSNAPAAVAEEEDDASEARDLDAIREELKRRNAGDGSD